MKLPFENNSTFDDFLLLVQHLWWSLSNCISEISVTLPVSRKMAIEKWSFTWTSVIWMSYIAIWTVQSPNLLLEINQNVLIQPPPISRSFTKRSELLKILQSLTLWKWEVPCPEYSIWVCKLSQWIQGWMSTCMDGWIDEWKWRKDN